MLYRVQACIAIASVFVALPVTAEQTKSQDNPEIYRSLSEELPSLPLPLVSQEGLPRFLESTDRNTLLFKDGSIVDQNGSFASLPDHARFKPLDGRAGLYLVEYSDGTQPVLRLAHVKEATMVLSPTLPNTYAPGSLTPLPDGSVAAITGGRHGSTSIIFDAYMIEDRALVPGSKSIVRRLPSGYLALSAVSHPRSGISGYVFVGESSAVIAFPSEPNISIHLSKGTRIFAAGQKHLIVGFFNPDCPAKDGLPEGTCTPFLFDVPVPERDLSLTSETMSQYRMVSASRAGWTSGALHKIDERSDFRVVGDRLYTVSYQGMNQAIGYFSLSNPGVSKTIISPEQGTDLAFSIIGGEAGAEHLFIERRHLIEPVRFHLIGPDDSSKLVYAAEQSPALAAAGLGYKTFPARPDALLSPMVILGRQETIAKDVCAGGIALVEVYGGPGVAMRPSNPVGLIPDLFEKNGIHVIVSLPGSGGYGLPWVELGSFGNSANQTLSLRQTLRVLKNNGCDKIMLTGFSHGGVVSLNTALRYPDLVDSVVIGGAPLDLEREYASNNRSIGAFLPVEADLSPETTSPARLQDAIWNEVSPKRLVEAASNLSGLSVTIIVGALDNRASTYSPEDLLTVMRSKGASVELVVRPEVGHYRYVSRAQWAEYHSILGAALRNVK